MITTSKRSKIEARDLVEYLSGTHDKFPRSLDMTQLSVALVTLLDRPEIDDAKIVSRVRSLITRKHCSIYELNILRRALKVKRDGEPLVSELMHVRRAYSRRKR